MPARESGTPTSRSAVGATENESHLTKSHFRGYDRGNMSVQCRPQERSLREGITDHLQLRSPITVGRGQINTLFPPILLSRSVSQMPYGRRRRDCLRTYRTQEEIERASSFSSFFLPCVPNKTWAYVCCPFTFLTSALLP